MALFAFVLNGESVFAIMASAAEFAAFHFFHAHLGRASGWGEQGCVTFAA